MPAGEVGHHIDGRPLNEVDTSTDGGDLARELMPHDPRIFEKGMRALEDVQVGATHPHPPDLHHNLVLAGYRPRPLDQAEGAGLLAQDRAHGRYQCETRMGQAVLSRIERVTPPNISSRIRE